MTDIKAQAEQHAAKEYPREACGLVVQQGNVAVYWPCRNIAEGSDHFYMHPADYAMAELQGPILAVIHSHPDASAEPSKMDTAGCETAGIPWLIVSWPSREWRMIEPSGYAMPLVGRPWAHGLFDCYSVVRDWYAQERGVALPDFERGEDWWDKGGDLYAENFRVAGFKEIPLEQIERGDVILMQVLSNVANHGAIYLGDDSILHHLCSRLSCRTVYGGYWKKHTCKVLRYVGNENDNSVGGTGP